MGEDFLDKKIKNAFIEKIDKPKEYNLAIKNALINENKINSWKKTNSLKKVACFLLIILLATSIVFSKDISAFLNKYLLKMNSNKGVQEAIDNGYIQEINTKHINSNGVNIRIKEILMDDFNLLILFDIEIPEIESAESIYYLKLCNLVITDEQDNVIALTLENSNKYKEFYNQRNIQETSKNIAYNKGAYYGEIIAINGKNIEYKYITNSENFPRSKKLNINFDKIILENKNSNEKTVIEGNWNMEVNLPEKMYNREMLIYSVKSCNKDDIIITKAQVSNTEMEIELITKWGKPVYTKEDSKEERERKIEEFFNNSHSTQNILIKNEYVENSNGERFYPVINSNDGNCGYNKMLNGYLRYWQTFNLTKYNATDTLKVVLEKQGEIIEIELEKYNNSRHWNVSDNIVESK